jgi:hypothetical protein
MLFFLSPASVEPTVKTWQREQRFAALTSSSILVKSEKSSRVLTLAPSSTTFGAVFFRGAIVHNSLSYERILYRRFNIERSSTPSNGAGIATRIRPLPSTDLD